MRRRAPGSSQRVNAFIADQAKAVEAVWRIESAKIIAALARLVKDLSLAEELSQDAFVAALERWPRSGIPDNPGAWLMTVAKRKAIDLIRRNNRLERKHEELGHEIEDRQEIVLSDFESSPDGGDDLLGLMFLCCHPILSRESRVALTLRLVGGLTIVEIARAFLVSEPTMAQRIGRAKESLAEAGVPFELPSGDELASRLASVLEVIYLVFNEGYSATMGEEWMRPALCEDALRIGRILASLAPKEAEVYGLVALMEFQASRSRARIGPKGEPVLLLKQDRSRWDQLLIRRGLAALGRAERLGGAFGPYALQAAIAACHARARLAEETDWARIAAFYDALAQLAPSPIVDLNRAVTIGMAYGPAAGLDLVDRLAARGALSKYHLLPSVRGDFLAKLGNFDAARAEFSRAAEMTHNLRERDLLLARAEACSRGMAPER